MSPSVLSSDVSKQMEKMTFTRKAPIIFRGKTGKQVNVMSNYLRLDSRPDIGVFEYEVRFDPSIDMRNEKFKILQQLKLLIGKFKASRRPNSNLSCGKPIGILSLKVRTLVRKFMFADIFSLL